MFFSVIFYCPSKCLRTSNSIHVVPCRVYAIETGMLNEIQYYIQFTALQQTAIST